MDEQTVVPNETIEANVGVQQPQLPTTTPVTSGGNDFGFDPNDETFATFNEQLKTYLGVDAYTLRSFTEYIADQRREAALTPLRQEWGDAYDNNFELVRERWSKLPPHEQTKYDSVDGAKYLLWQVQQEQAQANNQTEAVPTFDRGRTSVPQSSARFKYKLSDIQSLPKNEYAKQAQEIATAFAQGLVDLGS